MLIIQIITIILSQVVDLLQGLVLYGIVWYMGGAVISKTSWSNLFVFVCLIHLSLFNPWGGMCLSVLFLVARFSLWSVSMKSQNKVIPSASPLVKSSILFPFLLKSKDSLKKTVLLTIQYVQMLQVLILLILNSVWGMQSWCSSERFWL